MVRERLTSCLAGVMIAVAACTPALGQALVVGGKNFTEQLLLAEITAQLLTAKGFAATTRTGFATNGVRTEQEIGQVDLYWEYTGTSLVTFNRVAEKLEPDEAFRRVKELDARRGLIWLSPSNVDNTYALAMRREDAAAKGIVSISDLAARARSGERFKLATNLEFFLRPDGLLPLQRTYSFEFGPENVVRMETGAVYQALRDSPAVDVGIVFSTDGRVAALELSLLRDDRNFFPSYILAPVVRLETLKKHPELEVHLGALSSKLDSAAMATLNALVDIQKMRVEDVASSFLKASGLVLASESILERRYARN